MGPGIPCSNLRFNLSFDLFCFLWPFSSAVCLLNFVGSGWNVCHVAVAEILKRACVCLCVKVGPCVCALAAAVLGCARDGERLAWVRLCVGHLVLGLLGSIGDV